MSTSYLPPTGGLPVIRPAPLHYGPDAVQGIRLITDTHFGAANCDEELVRTECEEARHYGDRIILGGDIYDCIQPSDRRRYTPGAIHPRFRGRDDLMNAVTEWATEFLAPYAHLIDAVGVGNHETESVYRHCYDPVRQLVQNLNAGATERPALCKGASRFNPIQEAGYTAYICYDLKPEDGEGRTGRFTIWYHHGSGKTASAAGAIKNLRSKASFFSADLYWSGHSHTRCMATERLLRPGRGGRVLAKDVKLVVTGSYLHAYGTQGARSVRRRGRKSNYASDLAVSPTGLGGARVLLQWGESGAYPEEVSVVQ